jgi:hypothetical protein
MPQPKCNPTRACRSPGADRQLPDRAVAADCHSPRSQPGPEVPQCSPQPVRPAPPVATASGDPAAARPWRLQPAPAAASPQPGSRHHRRSRSTGAPCLQPVRPRAAGSDRRWRPRQRSAQQRSQRRPDVVQHARVGLGLGVDAVGLEQATASGPSATPARKKGTSATFSALATRVNSAVEVLAVLGGRSWAAPACPAAARGAGGLGGRVISARLCFGAGQRQAAQGVVAAQFDHHHRGLVRFSSAGSRERPPEVVSPLMLALTTCQGSRSCARRAPAVPPSPAAGQAVFGRQAVAHHQQRARRPLRCGNGPATPRPPGSRLQSRSHCRLGLPKTPLIDAEPIISVQRVQAGGRRHRSADHSP